MKKISLNQNGTFLHQWLDAIHGNSIPSTAIEVTDAVFMALSQNPQSKKYDPATQIVSEYVPPFILSEALTLKRSQIETARDAALNDQNATVDAAGAMWQSSPSAMAELNDTLTLSTGLGAVPNGIEWRDESNVNHPATLELLLAIGAARAVQKNAIWQTSWALKEQLDALNPVTATQADIDAIEVIY